MFSLPPSAARPIVRASGLGLLREGIRSPLLTDLSLELRPGECLLLEGRTGCGKSSLLRALAGLSGVAFGGGPLLCSARVTLLLQHVETQLLCTTCGEEVALGLRGRRLPSSRVGAFVRTALERVGLAGFERREVDRLSAGQKQRVVLAALLALEPEVLLLDEPCSALDASGRAGLAAVLADLKERGTSLLVADHAPAELLAVVDRRMAIEGNRLVDASGPQRVSSSVRRAPPAAGPRTLVTGPNGSGKSARLRAMAARASGDGEAALVIQEPRRSLFARTVERELSFGLRHSQLSGEARRARTKELLARLDLEPCADRSPRRLSFGQQHRLAIAAALVASPPLLLLDEPFAGLDLSARGALLELLEDEQARTGAAIVVASHDREPLATWCDEVVCLSSREAPDV